MARSKNKRTKKRKRNHISRKSTVEKVSFLKEGNRIVLWLAATGLLAVFGSFVSSFISGNVDLVYLKAAGRGYEFKLINQSSADQVVESFRISPDFSQGLLFKVTEDVVGTIDEEGVTIPGGNISYIPAYEFKGIDGQIIPAGGELKFRVPPLVSRSYMEPTSMIVYAEYDTKSNSYILSFVDGGLELIGVRDKITKLKYLVADNYWTPLAKGNDINAIAEACRDNDLLSKSSICKDHI